jgi:hypothetical protein
MGRNLRYCPGQFEFMSFRLQLILSLTKFSTSVSYKIVKPSNAVQFCATCYAGYVCRSVIL